jgi:alkanesulfonate monooxygenase SsuD/methylene tetrahydromethanopterin reductase-like flavin-dependent oxidoreductase (luciferase family)
LPEVERRVGWPELRDLARTAEQVGLDSIWVGDHLLYDLPGGTVRGPWEAWTTLAALAAVTERVRLGPLVASLGFHDPAMIAKFAATVDEISAGRLVVGVGAGWNRREYDAFGLAFDHRVDRFEEAFHLLRRLLAGETVDHEGRYHRLRGCLIDPPPRAGGPPLMVGSIGSRMQSITLPHVSCWNVWFSDFGNEPARLRSIVDEVRARCHRLGRDPDQVGAGAAVLVQAPGGTGRVMGEGPAVPPVTGSIETVADRLAEFIDCGLAELMVVLDPITSDSVRWLGGVAAVTRRLTSG